MVCSLCCFALLVLLCSRACAAPLCSRACAALLPCLCCPAPCACALLACVPVLGDSGRLIMPSRRVKSASHESQPRRLDSTRRLKNHGVLQKVMLQKAMLWRFSVRWMRYLFKPLRMQVSTIQFGKHFLCV